MPVAIPTCRNVLFDARRHPRVARLDDADRGRRERRVDEADADAARRGSRGGASSTSSRPRCPYISSSATPHEREPAAEQEAHGHARRQPSRRSARRRTTSSESGRKITPVFTARVAEHVLEVERQEEELREHPGRDREGGDLRAGERRDAEEADVEHRRLAAAARRARTTTRSTTAATKRPTTRPLDQPQSLPRKQPEHERKQAARQRDEAEHVEAARLLVARLVQHAQRRRRRTRSPIGRLTKKIQRQPTYVVSAPPTSGPIATAAPTVAPQMPKAVPRSRPWNSCEMIASETANIAAPPIPCTPRARISQSGDCAAPQRAEASVKSAIPPRKTRLRPSRSPSEPALSSVAASGKGVGVDDPLQIGEGGVQLLVDVRQRDVDYRDVEEQHEDRHAHDDEDAPFPLH